MKKKNLLFVIFGGLICFMMLFLSSCIDNHDYDSVFFVNQGDENVQYSLEKPGFWDTINWENVFSKVYRTGYDFLGIYEEADGQGKQYIDPNFKLNDGCYFHAGQQYYAYYKVKRYDIKFYSDDLKRVYKVMNDVEFDSVIEQFDIPNERRTGQVFDGWYNGNGERVIDGNGIPVNTDKKFDSTFLSSDEAKLHAVWVYETYSVTFIDEVKNTQYVEYCSYGSTIEPKKIENFSNYEFLGWSYSDSKTNTKYYNDEKILSDITLYAIYTQYNNISFYFKNDVVLEKKVYDDGSKYWLSQLDLPEFTGYTIKGMYDEYNKTSQIDYVNFNSNSKIYIDYQPIDYKITLGIDKSTNIDGEKYIYYNIESEFDLPLATKDNYVFLGWKNNNFSNAIFSITKGTYGDFVLYPIFKGKDIEITYDVGEGNLNENSKIITYGSDYNLDIPSIGENKKFYGWYILKNNKKIYITDYLGASKEKCKFEEDLTVYADYFNYYYVIPNCDSKGTVKNLNLYYFENDIVALTIEDNPGYEFTNYVINGNTYTSREINFLMPNKNVEIVINYKPITYTVEFDLNGGNDCITNDTVDYNSSYELPTPSKTGYNFLGWYLSNDESKTEIIGNITWTYTKNIKLIAKYEPITFYITYDAGIGKVNTSTKELKYGENYKLAVPNANDKAFVGWYILNGDEKVYITDQKGNSLNICDFYTELTVYAEYKDKLYINITYSSKQCEIIGLEDFYFEGQEVNIDILEKTGYKFVNYKINGKSYELKNINFVMENKNVEISINLKAKTYQAKFHLADGSDNISEYEFEYDSNIILPVPSRVGYEFVGWYLSTDSNKTIIDNMITWTYDTDIEFIAEWKSDTDSIIINNQSDLLLLSDKSNKGKNVYLAHNIQLTNDFVLECNYSGIFNGCGYKISNISSSLFNYFSGTIFNVTLEGNITSANNEERVGILASELNGNAVIHDVTILGEINLNTSKNDIGGIAGYISSNSVQIYNCVNKANIITKSNSYSIGGIIGAAGNYSKILNCENYGNISGGSNAGGIVGWTNTAGEIRECINYGDISSSFCGQILGKSNTGTVSIISCHVYGTSTGSKYVGGGSVSYNLGVFSINSINDLKAIKDNISIEKYKLEVDLDFSNITWEAFDLNAELDGNGHTLKNLTIESKDEYLGLFKNVSGSISNLIINNFSFKSIASISILTTCGILSSKLTGTISNVNITDSELIVKYGIVGAFTGIMDGGSIENCTNGALVLVEKTSSTSESIVGGFIGKLNSGNLSNLTNNSAITGVNYVGGVVGYSNKNTSSKINNIINNGVITAERDYVGGLFGYYKTTNDTLSNLSNFKDVSGKNYVGGIFGYFYGNQITNANVIFDEKINNNDVILITGDSYVGGIIGYGQFNNSGYILESNINNCKIIAKYMVGGIAGSLEKVVIDGCCVLNSTVEASSYVNINSVYYAYLGGIVGKGYSVLNCTNDTKISYDNIGINVGGIAGYSNGTISNCKNNGIISAEKVSNVGGLVGYVDHTDINSKIIFSENVNFAVVSGLSNVGGLFGNIYSNNSAYDLQILDSINYGTIVGIKTNNNSEAVGGIIGKVIVPFIEIMESDNKSYDDNDKNNKYNMIFKSDIEEISIEIKNSIIGSNYVGGLVGYAKATNTNSIIYISSSSFTIDGNTYVGGLAGYASGIKISDCSNEGTEIGNYTKDYNEVGLVNLSNYIKENEENYAYIGGYAGYVGSLEGLENKLNISYDGEGGYIGGLAGYLENTANGCSNTANVSALKATSVGGIVGYINNNAKNGQYSFTNNVNKGKIIGHTKVGGIFGEIKNNVSTDDSWVNYVYIVDINNCTNSGEIIAKDGQFAGGIVGSISIYCKATWYTWGANSTAQAKLVISQCINSGNVTSTKYSGGIVGYASANDSSSLISGCNNSGDVEAKDGNTLNSDAGQITGGLDNVTQKDNTIKE